MRKENLTRAARIPAAWHRRWLEALRPRRLRPWVARFVTRSKSATLSKPAYETLTVIAYRQS